MRAINARGNGLERVRHEGRCLLGLFPRGGDVGDMEGEGQVDLRHRELRLRRGALSELLGGVGNGTVHEGNAEGC